MAAQSNEQGGQLVVTGTNPPADVMQIDLMEFLYHLLASWKLLMCLGLCFALAAGIYTTKCIKPTYKATSKIYVVSNSDSVINMSDLQLGSALTGDYIQVFDIWEVHEAVIANLNLPYDYSTLSGMLSVTNPTNTRMLVISVTSQNPDEAALIANEYAKTVSKYIAAKMNTDEPSIMSTALVPSNPIAPNKTKNVMVAGILGVLLGAAIVFIRMIADDTYKTMDDIRKYTTMPVLAVVPAGADFKGSAKRRNER